MKIKTINLSALTLLQLKRFYMIMAQLISSIHYKPMNEFRRIFIQAANDFNRDRSEMSGYLRHEAEITYKDLVNFINLQSDLDFENETIRHIIERMNIIIQEQVRNTGTVNKINTITKNYHKLN